MTPTPEQLAEWWRLAEAATPGPWEVRRHAWPRDGYDGTDIVAVTRTISDPDTLPTDADAAFIVASRSAVPALLAEVERLQVAWSAEHDAYIRADEQARMAKRDADELRGEVRELQNRLSAADPDIVWID